jgi:hypothetical protein
MRSRRNALAAACTQFLPLCEKIQEVSVYLYVTGQLSATDAHYPVPRL